MRDSRETLPPPERTVVLEHAALRELDGFTQIPNVVLKHPGLSYGAKVTWGVLMSYAWQKDFCFPAQDRLARDMNCTVRQVQRLLGELREAGFVRWKQQGLNRPNVYYLRIPKMAAPADLTSEAAKSEDTTDLSHPDTTPLSLPEATNSSVQDATNPSPKVYPLKKTQYVDVRDHSLEDGRVLTPLSDGLKAVSLKLKPAAHPERLDYLAGLAAEEFGDRTPLSVRTYRRIAGSLGEAAFFQVLASTREAARDRLITGRRGAYFVGMAKKVAAERGIDLGLKSDAAAQRHPLAA